MREKYAYHRYQVTVGRSAGVIVYDGNDPAAAAKAYHKARAENPITADTVEIAEMIRRPIEPETLQAA